MLLTQKCMSQAEGQEASQHQMHVAPQAGAVPDDSRAPGHVRAVFLAERLAGAKPA